MGSLEFQPLCTVIQLQMLVDPKNTILPLTRILTARNIMYTLIVCGRKKGHIQKLTIIKNPDFLSCSHET